MTTRQLISREDCEEAARQVLLRHGIDRWPIKVDRVAKRAGIKVQYSPLDDELSGMAFYKDDVAVIGVNARHHVRRQRFTIAHEIGHFELHDEVLRKGMHVDKVITMLNRDTNSASGTISIEIEANQFAAELLMPKDLVLRYMEEASLDYGCVPDDEAIEAMARAFNVSATAMTYRIAKVL